MSPVTIGHMGAWGTGAFENDDALDFAGELEDAAPAEREALAHDRLRGVAEQVGPLEAEAVNEAVAAVALVCASAYPAHFEEEPYLPEWVTSSPLSVGPELADAARVAARRAGDPRDNEWYDLWDEVGEEPRALVDRFLEALG